MSEAIESSQYSIVCTVLVLMSSMSLTSVRAAQYNQYPPYEFGSTSGYYIPTGTGGLWNHTESVNYNTGYIRLYAWFYNALCGDIQVVAQGWVCTFPVYATSSGVVSIASKVHLYGSGHVLAIAALPWGSYCDLAVQLRYKVYDASMGQWITDTLSYDFAGHATGMPYPEEHFYSWNEDHDISGSFSATSGHYYEVYVYFTVATRAAGASGFGQAEANFRGGYYALVEYISMSGPLGNPPGGGGCPYLNVYDGSQWICEGLLDIHTGYNGTDLAVKHVLTTAPQAVDNRYLLHLTEHWSSISHIDSVKLYATLENGKVVTLPLLSAVHSQYGNVLPQLLRSDDRRVDTLGSMWNNGTSQSIDLRFLALPSSVHAVSFTFVIEGYNPNPTY